MGGGADTNFFTAFLENHAEGFAPTDLVLFYVNLNKSLYLSLAVA